MKTFYFREAYKMASLVQEVARLPETFVEIPWDHPHVVGCVGKHSRISILHYYIAATIAVYYRRQYRKNNDFMEESDISAVERTFSMYEIYYQPFHEFRTTADLGDSNELRDEFYQWFSEQEKAFIDLWERTTEEVFHLLFGDRHFLMIFNASLAQYLASGKVQIPSKYLRASGGLRRCSYIPSWARKAVFFRERGKCALCCRDLSGLLTTDFTRHLDHIVALSKWGVNDPANLQLLCDSCNLRKGAGTPATSPRYSPWWDEDSET